jgi:hypothetical protein
MQTMILALNAEKHNTLNMCFMLQLCSMLNIIGPEASINAKVIIDKAKKILWMIIVFGVFI